MHAGAEASTRHHGRTGAAGYDAVGFSAPPVADLIFHERSGISAIRHFGLHGSGTCHAASHKLDIATLTLDLGAVGTCAATIDGQRYRKPFRRNQFSFIPAGLPLELEFPAEHSCVGLYVPDHLLAATAGAADRLAEPVLCEPDDRAADLFRMLTREIAAPGFASDLALDRLLASLVHMVTRQPRVRRGQPDRLYIAPAALRRVREYIDAYLARPLTLNELADVAGLSPYYFCRMFKLATGYSPYHYVAWQRLTRAARLLSETATPLDAVAQSCGFANVSHFTTAFRREIGVSPGRYRRAHRDIY